MKFTFYLIELIYWLLIALCPLLVFCVMGFVIYHYVFPIAEVLIIFGVIGVIIGVVLAEKIRRKFKSCSNFYSQLMNTDDLNKP